MKLIQLPDVLHEYLLEVIHKHSAQGIHPEEGLAVNRLWVAVTQATHIPDTDIQKMATAATPQGQSTPKSRYDDPTVTGGFIVEDHTGEPITVECKDCWENEGSHACLRFAHCASFPDKTTAARP